MQIRYTVPQLIELIERYDSAPHGTKARILPEGVDRFKLNTWRLRLARPVRVGQAVLLRANPRITWTVSALHPDTGEVTITRVLHDDHAVSQRVPAGAVVRAH